MIARKSALIIGTELLNGALGYVSLFFITRYIGPSNYGTVAFAIGFVSLFLVLENMGYHHSHIKKISEGKDLGICNGTFLISKIGLTALLAVFVLTSLFIWKNVVGRGFETPEHEIAIYIILGYYVIRSLSYFFEVTFRAKREIAKKQIPLFLETLVRVGATIYVAMAGYGALALAFTYVIGDIAFFLTGLYLFRGNPIKKPSKQYFKEYTYFALPLILVVVSATVMNNIDKVFIQLFWSSSDVGYYFAGFKLSHFINLFTVALITLLFPTYSALHSNKNLKRIIHLTYQSERYISMIAFPMVFGMVILAEPATFILLSGWTPSIPILQILPFYALLAGLEAPYQSQFLGTNRPKLTRNRVLIMVITNVFLNLILIPKDIQSLGLTMMGLGTKGAAIATVISFGIGLFYSRYSSWKITGAKGNWRVLLHALAASIMVLFLYILLYHFGYVSYITRWYHLLGTSFLGLGIYIIVLYLLKEFTGDDFKFFLDTLNIKKMLVYIWDEVKRK